MLFAYLLLLSLGKVNYSIFPIFWFASGSFLVTYLVVRYLAERYIFRKIKLIYKVIGRSKNSLRNEDLDSNVTTLEDVNDTAMAWALSTEKEISSLKSLENYRKNFIGDVSHELKTPLFSIQGYLLTLLEGGLYDENINKKYLLRAVDNVDRLKNIVDDLEMINSLESEKNVLVKQKFNIKELAEQVFGDLKFQAAKKNIELKFKPGANQSFNVTADKERIRQVLSNLVGNSIKYGVEDGLTKVSFYDMEERVLVEVSDNGIGIGEDDAKHVYDRFYRADKSRSRDVGGSGLGLAIVKHIIEAHEQTLSLRSTDGKGSTFGFTLVKANNRTG